MVIIESYNGSSFSCICNKCDVSINRKFRGSDADDYVSSIKIKCPDCGDSSVVFFLRCVNEFKADSLMAHINKLKSKEYDIT